MAAGTWGAQKSPLKLNWSAPGPERGKFSRDVQMPRCRALPEAKRDLAHFRRFEFAVGGITALARYSALRA